MLALPARVHVRRPLGARLALAADAAAQPPLRALDRRVGAQVLEGHQHAAADLARHQPQRGASRLVRGHLVAREDGTAAEGARGVRGEDTRGEMRLELRALDDDGAVLARDGSTRAYGQVGRKLGACERRGAVQAAGRAGLRPLELRLGLRCARAALHMLLEILPAQLGTAPVRTVDGRPGAQVEVVAVLGRDGGRKGASRLGVAARVHTGHLGLARGIAQRALRHVDAGVEAAAAGCPLTPPRGRELLSVELRRLMGRVRARCSVRGFGRHRARVSLPGLGPRLGEGSGARRLQPRLQLWEGLGETGAV